MIVAGIDEAGLGPTLGPLVTASASWRVDEGGAGEGGDPSSPWSVLESAVARQPRKRDPRIAVGDSKKVYTAGGLGALERSLSALLTVAAGIPRDADGRLDMAAALSLHGEPEAGQLPPWQEATDWRVAPDDAAAALLRDTPGLRELSLHARALHPSAFNARIERGMNKNELLLGETAAHVKRLSERYPGETLRVWIDMQGGRRKYAPCLSEWFGGAWVETLAETGSASAYRLKTPSGAVLWATFAVKADATAFGVALASMTAKYVRERFMATLNAWFAQRIPGLRPTAGYPEDAERFILEASSALESPEDGRLIRVR